VSRRILISRSFHHHSIHLTIDPFSVRPSRSFVLLLPPVPLSPVAASGAHCDCCAGPTPLSAFIETVKFCRVSHTAPFIIVVTIRARIPPRGPTILDVSPRARRYTTVAVHQLPHPDHNPFLGERAPNYSVWIRQTTARVRDVRLACAAAAAAASPLRRPASSSSSASRRHNPSVSWDPLSTALSSGISDISGVRAV